MNSRPNAPEHLFIRNPYTGKLINVLPLLEFMSQDPMVPNSSLWLVAQIQAVHDYLSIHIPVSPGSEVDSEKWIDMNYTLIEFRKVFERMTEVSA